MKADVDTATVQLPTGTLSYHGEASNTLALSALCDVGARRNPKRGFVFVSKVLGKHWPSAPAQMLALHQALAAQIPVDDPAPIIFIGMAETATGLGHGVFEAYLARAPRQPALFLQTTRYPLGGASPIEFQEEHSHATQLYLYRPASPAHRELLARAATVVLIDDEATTGKTFFNLALALRDACPALRCLVPVILTDFTQGALATRLAGVPGIARVHPVSLWRGAYEFVRDPAFQAEEVAVAFAPVACRREHVSTFTGRLGLGEAMTLPETMLDHCERLLNRPNVLVIGTGECMHPAFRLALALETRGFDVRVQSTTRSPLMQAAAISDVMQVVDPYGEGIPNYLYNLSMSGNARRVLVHETREHALASQLAAQLDAIEFALATRCVLPRKEEAPCDQKAPRKEEKAVRCSR